MQVLTPTPCFFILTAHPFDFLSADTEGAGFLPSEDDQSEMRRAVIGGERLMTQDVWLFRERRDRKCSGGGEMAL